MLGIRCVKFAQGMTIRGRALTAACGAAVVAGALIPVEARQQAPTPSVSTVINQYCVSCHNGRMKTGGLALDAIASHDGAQEPDVWEKVLRKIRARHMPPMGSRRPDEATYETTIASLETSLDRAAAAAPNPGRTATLRRLTRTEYQN